jgi:hypothetical protein
MGVLAMPGRPAVLDTTALIAGLCGATNHNTDGRLLAALESGMVLGYAAEHVWAEVPRKLHTIADEGRVDGTAAAELWWNRYVRFVDTDTLVAPPEALRLVNEDRTDVPTAKLAALLAPIPVLAADRDLIRHELAHPHWKATVAAGADQELVHRQIYGTAYGTWLIGRAALAAAKGISRQMAKPGIFGLVAATTVVASITTVALLVADDPQGTRTLGRNVANVAKDLAIELGSRRD